ncbi:zf-TFIIB domain-containing protein [Candidatus Roizmanbacteria bacterium]|nr:zf-TFIIB domain-containing protein [Candidatus Roizmanbacteria bacterium]
MYCPNCSEEMNSEVYENQPVLHCSHCGCSFFEENGLSKIGKGTARYLAHNKKSDFILSSQKLCPKDSTVMSSMHNNDEVLQNIPLSQCTVCRGIFIYPEDLLTLKKARETPFPALRAVLVFSFFTLFSLSALAGFVTLQTRNATQTRADDIIKNVAVSQSGRYFFFSFKTLTPVRSEVTFINTRTKKVVVKTLSSTAKTLHYITTTDMDPISDLSYFITLTDEKGRVILKTETKKLSIISP